MTVEAIRAEQQISTRFTVAKNKSTEPLRECVKDALNSYFKQLDGHTACDLYQMVLAEVEKPLLETVMQHTEGNQSRASTILGISRSTLRKKLALYNLD
ncbi:MAG: DNA-binding transcriptional regulator Fis [Sedimenticola sp.]|jgi:Fis family transcriptional regulator|nr:MAG: DNA-binding transcriptional regulator Fis [Sedimenticola sp.]